MPPNFKPMMATDYFAVTTQPEFAFVSEKLIGERCIFLDGIAYSQYLHPFPNKLLQSIAHQFPMLNMLDCVIIAYDVYNNTDMQVNMDFCMGIDSLNRFSICVYDIVDTTDCFHSRMMRLSKLFTDHYSELPSNSECIEHLIIAPAELAETTLDEYASHILTLGGAGVMIHDGYAPYSYGLWDSTNAPPLQVVCRTTG